MLCRSFTFGDHEGSEDVARAPPRHKGVDERRAFPLPTEVSHTMMIDLIYLVVGVYCLLVVFLGPESFQSQSVQSHR